MATGTTRFESYEQARDEHSWDVPERYNIAADVCDKHPPDQLAMVHEHFDGTVREVQWGELQADANRFADVLGQHGVGKGDRVAMLLPPTPETAAAFFGTWKRGAILLSMSVLYGDDGIRHRVKDSQAKVLVTNADNADRIEPELVDEILILDARPARLGRRRADPRGHAGRRSRPSSTTPPGPPASPRGSCTPIATCSGTRSSSTATTCSPASSSTAWASGRGPRALRRCSGRGGSARCRSSTSARAASTPTSSSTCSRATRSRTSSRRRRRCAR